MKDISQIIVGTEYYYCEGYKLHGSLTTTILLIKLNTAHNNNSTDETEYCCCERRKLQSS